MFNPFPAAAQSSSSYATHGDASPANDRATTRAPAWAASVSGRRNATSVAGAGTSAGTAATAATRAYFVPGISIWMQLVAVVYRVFQNSNVSC
jgi:hypothetical protein